MRTFILKEQGEPYSTKQIHTPQDAYEMLRPIYDTLDDGQEHFVVLFLNSKNQPIYWKNIFSGGKNATYVDVAIVLRSALLCGATAILLSHNHPSGDMQPSEDDIEITRKIKKACELIDITLVDHIIVGNGFYSMKENEDV